MIRVPEWNRRGWIEFGYQIQSTIWARFGFQRRFWVDDNNLDLILIEIDLISIKVKRFWLKDQKDQFNVNCLIENGQIQSKISNLIKNPVVFDHFWSNSIFYDQIQIKNQILLQICIVSARQVSLATKFG